MSRVICKTAEQTLLTAHFCSRPIFIQLYVSAKRPYSHEWRRRHSSFGGDRRIISAVIDGRSVVYKDYRATRVMCRVMTDRAAAAHWPVSAGQMTMTTSIDQQCPSSPRSLAGWQSNETPSRHAPHALISVRTAACVPNSPISIDPTADGDGDRVVTPRPSN